MTISNVSGHKIWKKSEVCLQYVLTWLFDFTETHFNYSIVYRFPCCISIVSQRRSKKSVNLFIHQRAANCFADLFEKLAVLGGREAGLHAAFHRAIHQLPSFDQLLLAHRRADGGTHHLRAQREACVKSPLVFMSSLCWNGRGVETASGCFQPEALNALPVNINIQNILDSNRLIWSGHHCNIQTIRLDRPDVLLLLNTRPLAAFLKAFCRISRPVTIKISAAASKAKQVMIQPFWHQNGWIFVNILCPVVKAWGSNWKSSFFLKNFTKTDLEFFFCESFYHAEVRSCFPPHAKY